MPVMEWNDALVLDKGVMDETHREFIELLNRLAEAPDENMLAALDEFISHTEEQLRRLLAQSEGTAMAVRALAPLQGPQVPEKSVSQDDVDALMASLGF